MTPDICEPCTREAGTPSECAVIAADSAGLYRFRFTPDVAYATCPRCRNEGDWMRDFVEVSAIEKRETLPVFGPCTCGHRHKRDHECAMCGCLGEGWRIVAQHTRHVWLHKVCQACVADMRTGKREGAGRGFATAYTSDGRDTEAQPRRDAPVRTGVRLCEYGCGREIAKDTETRICRRCERKLGKTITPRMAPSLVRTRQA